MLGNINNTTSLTTDIFMFIQSSCYVKPDSLENIMKILEIIQLHGMPHFNRFQVSKYFKATSKAGWKRGSKEKQWPLLALVKTSSRKWQEADVRFVLKRSFVFCSPRWRGGKTMLHGLSMLFLKASCYIKKQFHLGIQNLENFKAQRPSKPDRKTKQLIWNTRLLLSSTAVINLLSQ